MAFGSGAVLEIAAATCVASGDDGKIVWVSNGAGSSYDTATEMCGLLEASMSKVNLEAIIIAGSDNAYVWFYDSDMDGSANISVNDFVLIGVLTGVAADNLTTANFVAAIA